MVIDKQGRSQRIAVRLTDDEMRMLQTMVDKSGLSASDVMRLALRQAFEETKATKPHLPTKQRPKK